jgi:hypothetical protein
VFPVRYGLYLCVPYGSYNKQRLFPPTELTGWIIYLQYLLAVSNSGNMVSLERLCWK